MHVERETRTVYRTRGAIRLTERAAYYAAAKRMIMAKYPPDLDWWSTRRAADELGVSAELADMRHEKRCDLLFCDGCSGRPDEPCEHVDPDKWVSFVSRVARFLRFVDSRRVL